MSSRGLTESLRETIALFDERGHPWTTSEVAEGLDVGRRSTYERLDRLVDRGRLDTKKVGANGRVWWRPPSSRGIDRSDEYTEGPAADPPIDDGGPATTAPPIDAGGLGATDPPIDGGSREQYREFRSVVRGIDEYAILLLGPGGRVRTWNEGARRIAGYRRGEVLGEHVSTFYTDADREAGVPDRTLERAAAEGVVTDEGRRVRADGSTFRAHVTVTALSDDGDLRGFAQVTRDVTERRERERTLERQREELAALDNLNGVVHDITEAVIDQPTREEVEEIVCDRLTAAGSYEFAWVGEVDPRTGSIVPRVETGVDGFLDAVSLTTDPDDPAGQGPAGRAVRTGEMQVARKASDGWDWGTWRECAEEYGFRSTAVIPIAHGDTLYGLLGVYADRAGAFGGKEWDVVAQLGEVVGHAIAAVDRKRALTSDEVTEIEFAVPDVVREADAAGTVRFEGAVPAGDGEFLQYGTVGEEGVPVLESFADRYPHFEDARVFGRGGETTRFELRAVEPPVVSVVASHGGSVRRARIEAGDLHATVRLPPTVAARRIVEAIRETYPTADLLTRRQVARDDPPTSVYREVTEDLTDRQRATLEAAVFAGYFGWPRDRSGEEVAESLGIAPPTFHQHLRKAQRTVFDAVFRTTT